MLYCLRGLKPDAVWKEGLLRGGFWSMNIGLGLMAVLTLLPMGVLQLEANLERGHWYARSAEFMNRPIIDLLVWLRGTGDTTDRTSVEMGKRESERVDSGGARQIKKKK